MTEKNSHLCQNDCDALDALIEAEFDLTQVPAALQDRAARIGRLLGLLDTLPAPSPGDLLTERTMQAIRAERQKHRIDRQISALTTPAPAARWPELIAVAAMILITIGIILPTVNDAREHARQIACQSNMAGAAAGFTTYTTASNGFLPATSTNTGDQWWHIGEVDDAGHAQSNSANLYVLINSGHVEPTVLNCPENPDAMLRLQISARDWPSANAVSYSYQNQFAQNQPRWGNGPVIAILADKNPRFGPGEFYNQIDAMAISSNHARLGGHNVLFSDGTVRWMESPLTSSGDNIWEADGVETYQGNEVPANAKDAFLVW